MLNWGGARRARRNNCQPDGLLLFQHTPPQPLEWAGDARIEGAGSAGERTVNINHLFDPTNLFGDPGTPVDIASSTKKARKTVKVIDTATPCQRYPRMSVSRYLLVTVARRADEMAIDQAKGANTKVVDSRSASGGKPKSWLRGPLLYVLRFNGRSSRSWTQDLEPKNVSTRGGLSVDTQTYHSGTRGDHASHEHLWFTSHRTGKCSAGQPGRIFDNPRRYQHRCGAVLHDGGG